MNTVRKEIVDFLEKVYDKNKWPIREQLNRFKKSLKTGSFVTIENITFYKPCFRLTVNSNQEDDVIIPLEKEDFNSLFTSKKKVYIKLDP